MASRDLSEAGINRLRPYQREVASHVLDSVFRRKGHTFSVEIARQGGKNELSAQLELLLLTLHIDKPQNLIKCSPTFKPQTVISMTRLKDRLNDTGFDGIWGTELGYIIRLGSARAIFLSADESANVVGHTANILLEIDESQDVSREKYTKEFKPMGATSNVTTVHYGTTWDGDTLLEEIKQTNYELERGDGIKRHFRYDWQEVAKYNPDYLAYVESERERLGENHPLFLTQYCLLPIRGGGGFLSSQQRAQLRGEHQRRHQPQRGGIYVAGNVQKQPIARVVEHYWWTGRKHTELYAQLVDILKNVWRCRRVVVDATGVGQPVSSFLRESLGAVVLPFTFTVPSKSELGFNLLAAVNSGRLKMYAADDSMDYRQFWLEMEKAKSHYRPSQTMNFYVDPAQGHDDFLMSLALTVEAARSYSPRGARGNTV